MHDTMGMATRPKLIILHRAARWGQIKRMREPVARATDKIHCLCSAPPATVRACLRAPGRETVVPPWIVIAAALVLVAGCALPPPPPPAVLGPLNSAPWVSTQSPPAAYTSAGGRAPFQTPNSLPWGAYNLLPGE